MARWPSVHAKAVKGFFSGLSLEQSYLILSLATLINKHTHKTKSLHADKKFRCSEWAKSQNRVRRGVTRRQNLETVLKQNEIEYCNTQQRTNINVFYYKYRKTGCKRHTQDNFSIKIPVKCINRTVYRNHNYVNLSSDWGWIKTSIKRGWGEWEDCHNRRTGGRNCGRGHVFARDAVHEKLWEEMLNGLSGIAPYFFYSISPAQLNTVQRKLNSGCFPVSPHW